jgi:hypothetical protein
MTAFAAQHEGAILARYIGRHAETGAGAERDHGRIRHGISTADGMEIIAGKMRQRPGDRFEIIDNIDPGQSEAGAQFGRIDDPRIIRERTACPSPRLPRRHRARSRA